MIDARRHTLEQSVVDPMLHVDADSARLAQAIANVLANAAKFTPPGGNIAIDVGRDGSDVCIRVRDDGIGMSEALVPQVFDLFAQGDRGLDRAEGGLGLGLTLAKQLLDLHGGSISAHSDGPGRGSAFVLKLPLVDAIDVVRPVGTETQSAPTLRVLVVDDNKDAADSTADVLRIHGHVVQTVYSGAAALGAARVFKPDVVLLDIGLPGIDGYEIARRLRAFPETQRSRIVALTGYGQPADRSRSHAAGIDLHVLKPLKAEELSSMLTGARAIQSTSE